MARHKIQHNQSSSSLLHVKFEANVNNPFQGCNVNFIFLPNLTGQSETAVACYDIADLVQAKLWGGRDTHFVWITYFFHFFLSFSTAQHSVSCFVCWGARMVVYESLAIVGIAVRLLDSFFTHPTGTRRLNREDFWRNSNSSWYHLSADDYWFCITRFYSVQHRTEVT